MSQKPTRILVIEDDQAMLSLIEDFLNLQGYTTTSHRIATKALQDLEVQAFDLLITDYNMPQMNGLDVLTSARDKKPQLPVILITAFGNDDIFTKAKQAGAQGFLNKPFRLSDLKEAVQSALYSKVG